MTDNRLIEEYTAELSDRLPQPIVDELLDGLAETYADQLARTTDEDVAAEEAIAEFGRPDVVVKAFIHHSPGRRLATALLATGPVVGLAWAAVLVTSSAWTWPIPISGQVAVGLLFLAALGALLTTTLNKAQIERTRATARFGALTVIALDAMLITTALILAGSHPWLLLAAITASALRLTFTLQRLPRVLAG